MAWKQRIRDHLREVLDLKTSPGAIAAGFTLGACISVLPTFGFGVFIGIVLTLSFKRISKIALFAGLAFWNPLTLIPLYSLSFVIGDAIFGDAAVKSFQIAWMNEVSTYTRRFLVGNFIVTGVIAVCSYWIVLRVAQRYQSE
ncbi:MAG: DUF2062 domain-containing protein [Leptospirales bacterium]|jgi:uncharacterized protein (DUF2062 family)